MLYTKRHLVVNFLFQSPWEDGIILLFPLFPGSLKPGLLEPVRVSYKGQIDLVEKYIYSKGILDAI